MAKDNGLGAERRIQGNGPLSGQNPAGFFPGNTIGQNPIPIELPSLRLDDDFPATSVALTFMEREVLRMCLLEFRFALSHQLANAPEGHMPPFVMSQKFVDWVAAGLIDKLRSTPSVLDSAIIRPTPSLEPKPARQPEPATDVVEQPASVRDISTVTEG